MCGTEKEDQAAAGAKENGPVKGPFSLLAGLPAHLCENSEIEFAIGNFVSDPGIAVRRSIGTVRRCPIVLANSSLTRCFFAG
jgi:hypothetical protein